MVRTVGAAPEPGVEAYQGGDIQAALGLWRSQTEAVGAEVAEGDEAETKAARASALYLLGAAYADPATDPFDETEAIRLWERAALLGDGLAMAALTRAYVEGRGVETDMETARCWGRPASKTGFRYAQFEIAFALPDQKEDVGYWLIDLAANRGLYVALERLAWRKPASYTRFDEVWPTVLLAEFGDPEKELWVRQLLAQETGPRLKILKAMIESATVWQPDKDAAARRFASKAEKNCRLVS
jgi:TPR repeat protein